VHRIWRAFSLQPHRTETFKLSTDPQFIEKVRDIVGLYIDPPDKALVICVDEKSQIQAFGSHSAAGLPSGLAGISISRPQIRSSASLPCLPRSRSNGALISP
jgi:hypothetical protein